MTEPRRADLPAIAAATGGKYEPVGELGATGPGVAFDSPNGHVIIWDAEEFHGDGIERWGYSIVPKVGDVTPGSFTENADDATLIAEIRALIATVPFLADLTA